MRVELTQTQEATEQATKLVDEDPALLVRYLVYLYSDSYPESDVSNLQSDSQFKKVTDKFAAEGNALQACVLHAQMYCFAKRRCDDRLEKFAMQEFSRNYWAKRPRQKLEKHNLEPKGLTRTLKYHFSVYIPGMEQTIIVGNKNTHAEIYDLLSDFADWDDIIVTSKRIRGNNDPLHPNYMRRRHRLDHWKDNALPLSDFDFDNTHLVIGRSSNSNAKNLSLLACISRWSNRTMSLEEQNLTRLVLTETTEYGPSLKDMISLDLTMRKHSGDLIPDPTYRTLQLDFPEFFLSIDSLVNPSERRQCSTCSSIQPVLRQPCSCGKWSDACEKDCLSKQVDKLNCFCCMDIGKMKLLVDRDRSVLPRTLTSAILQQGLMYPFTDHLLGAGDESDY